MDKCIPESVKNLRPPPPFPFHKGLVTAVTTVNELAQLHTVQGLNHLHGGWEFEASRHFAIAMREDPECLMAHWGMVMCLLSPSPETDEARIAATDRLLHLISEGKGTDLERGFAYGIVKYLEEGPAGAAKAYRQVADKFPGEIQSEIFAALFGRGGYDDLGSITPTQESSEQRLQTLIEKNPDNALPLHALLLIRAEAPDLRPSLELARRLTQLVPDYAPYFHLLGHYEWRCGEHAKAASAFGRAVTLFSTWMKENKAAPADCGEWVRSECYRVVALASKGDFDNALAAAEKISNTSVDPKRLAASGTRQILWEAQTLPARILLRRSDKGDPAKALAALPSPEAGKDIRARSLSYWWVDGLRIAIEAQRLLDTGVLDEASKTIEAISFHGQAMAKRQTMGAVIGERSQWIRSFRALEVLASELRGRLALAGPPAGHGSAFNWFRAAADRQKPTSMLSPPAILTPMAMRLGDYYLARNQPTEAIAAYNEALANFPNDLETLERLQKAYSAGNQTEKAAETDAIIKSLAPEAE
ncbi:MAG: tetratricopeptide repeat protein [Armatimonadetes bacterium]|nr:tetratricopeptide repeat protein [Akkermansiaceae bacterium]